ncbi:hypothetical protein HDU93_006473, partial [Gonapodya sp. JEL0774]
CLKFESSRRDSNGVVTTEIAKSLVGLLSRALKEQSADNPNPYNPDLSVENTSPLARFSVVKRYQARNNLLFLCLERVSEVKRLEIVEALHPKEMDNYDLTLV